MILPYRPNRTARSPRPGDEGEGTATAGDAWHARRPHHDTPTTVVVARSSQEDVDLVHYSSGSSRKVVVSQSNVTALSGEAALFIPAYRVGSGVLNQCDRLVEGSRLIHCSLQ